jgi:hypothetical protein
MIHGGCAGGKGGAGMMAGTGALGGDGGGAIYLIAGVRIDVVGSIEASGAGGRSCGGNSDGGGGGGSGGLIGLDAPLVMLSDTAVVIANGGGGGAGCNTKSGGTVGSDPNRMMPLVEAPGGMAPQFVGGGGKGSAAAIRAGGPGVAGVQFGGGGGGGGGAGHVGVYPKTALIPSTGARVSPPFQ